MHTRGMQPVLYGRDSIHSRCWTNRLIELSQLRVSAWFGPTMRSTIPLSTPKMTWKRNTNNELARLASEDPFVHMQEGDAMYWVFLVLSTAVGLSLTLGGLTRAGDPTPEVRMTRVG